MIDVLQIVGGVVAVFGILDFVRTKEGSSSKKALLTMLAGVVLILAGAGLKKLGVDI